MGTLIDLLFMYIKSSLSICLLEAEVHRGVELIAQDRKLELFWSGLRPVLDSGPVDSKLHDVAQLTYTIPDQPLTLHTQDPEAVVSWAEIYQFCGSFVNFLFYFFNFEF